MYNVSAVFRKDSFWEVKKMQAHFKSFILVILLGLASVGFAREAATPPGKESAIKTGDTNEVGVPSFPYTAVVTDDDAPIRSGPGTNYYICGKLKKGDKVNVVNSKFSWSCIVPPPGSLSWIQMRYVSIDPDNPAAGIVNTDGIRVYAGSEFKEPIHSDYLQLRLNRGDVVKFIGKQKGDYYKIVPPTGAYLWVSTQYTKPLVAPPVKVPRTVVTPPPVDTKTITKTDTKADTKADTKIIIPPRVSGESENLKAYHALEKLIQAERAKPANQRNYANIKKALAVIAGNKEAGKAARYAEFAIRQIKSFELAMDIAKEVQLQNEELQKTKEGIEKARATRLAQVEALGKYAVIGKFETSSILSSEAVKYYRIVDDNDKTVCYVLPTKLASETDLSKLAGSKVGLIGTIEPHPQTSGALVRFTKIVELK
jgi:SH3-like domain-containing protein